jgi:hypothetical protein
MLIRVIQTSFMAVYFKYPYANHVLDDAMHTCPIIYKYLLNDFTCHILIYSSGLTKVTL